MTLVGIGWLRYAVPRMRAAAIESVQRARRGVHEYARRGDDLRVLRRCEWDLDYVDAKQRRVRILVGLFPGASGELFARTDKRSTGHVDVDVVLVVGIDDERMRVRAAASLYS